MREENEALIIRLMAASDISREAAIEHCVDIARLALGAMGVEVRLRGRKQVPPDWTDEEYYRAMAIIDHHKPSRSLLEGAKLIITPEAVETIHGQVE